MSTPTITADKTIDDVKAAAVAAGSTFFSATALRNRSSFVSARIHVSNNGVYFVTSEQNGNGPRGYTVRYVANANPAKILTAGQFMSHATSKAAHSAAAKRVADVTN
jgi:hypothetical protein